MELVALRRLASEAGDDQELIHVDDHFSDISLIHLQSDVSTVA
ncbi:MAG: hypothetical protein ACR2Q4_00095 [Geminicoccaceae bacterium]